MYLSHILTDIRFDLRSEETTRFGERSYLNTKQPLVGIIARAFHLLLKRDGKRSVHWWMCLEIHGNSGKIDPDTAAIARARLQTVQPFLMPDMPHQEELEIPA